MPEITLPRMPGTGSDPPTLVRVAPAALSLTQQPDPNDRVERIDHHMSTHFALASGLVSGRVHAAQDAALLRDVELAQRSERRARRAARQAARRA